MTVGEQTELSDRDFMILLENNFDLILTEKNRPEKNWFMKFCKQLRGWREQSQVAKKGKTRRDNKGRVGHGISLLNKFGYKVYYGSQLRKEKVTEEDYKPTWPYHRPIRSPKFRDNLF